MPNGVNASGFLSALGQAFTGYGQDQQQERVNALAQQRATMDSQLHGPQMDRYRADADKDRAAMADRERRRQVIGQFGRAAIQGDASAIQEVIAVAPELAGTLTKAPPRGTYDSDRGVIVNPDGSLIRPQGLPAKPAPPRADQFTFTSGTDAEGRPVIVAGNTHTGQATPTPIGKPQTGGAAGLGAAAIRKAIADNKAQLQTIRTAIDELDAYPNAVGMRRGLGLIPGLGEVAGQANQRADPEGEKARNAIQNATSISIVNRSGKAVTKTEMAALGFLPNVASTHAANRQKLLDLAKYVESETGYLEAGMTNGRPSPQHGAPAGDVDLRDRPAAGDPESAWAAKNPPRAGESFDQYHARYLASGGH